MFDFYAAASVIHDDNPDLMPGVYATRKRDHRGRDGNLSQISTTSAMENSIAR